MKNRAILLAIIICVVLSCQYQTTNENDKIEIKKVVTDYYENLMKFDFNKIRSICSFDFQLVESSGIYPLEEYIGFLKPDVGKLKIEYSLQELKLKIDNKASWITYKKKTKIITDNKEILLEARESAVLTKKSNKWKLRLIHSSSIK